MSAAFRPRSERLAAATRVALSRVARLPMEVHRVTLGDFNPWFERRLARKYTPCLAGVVEALTPVLSCFATIRAQAEELGVAMLKEERSPTGVSASDASLPVVRQHVDNSIHLVDRIANTFPECPLDYEFLSGFVKHGRDCLKQLSLNSVSLQQLADAPYNEVHRASKAAHTPSPTPPATTAGRAFPPPPSRVPAPCPCAAEHGEPQGAQGPDGAQALDDPLGPRAAAARPRRPRGGDQHLERRGADPARGAAQAALRRARPRAPADLGRAADHGAPGALLHCPVTLPCNTALQHCPATPHGALQHMLRGCTARTDMLASHGHRVAHHTRRWRSSGCSRHASGAPRRRRGVPRCAGRLPLLLTLALNAHPHPHPHPHPQPSPSASPSSSPSP